ncbi:pyrroline-5-carboxylate reductase [Piscinibacter sakaiensis]|uniref:pyrroline-5-carboxylate reductase n=1 Tax=Piscinibacter sakaiensis TaxID=1547922 RepID=UPI003AAD2BA0
MNKLVFIGGGNMARAIIGGLLGSGRPASSVLVVDPGDAQRSALQSDFGITTLAAAGPELADAALVVWAVKPQLFGVASAPCAPHIGAALQLSVMAGIRSDTIARACGTERVVRAMPNTPALIGQGIAGLFARPQVTADERTEVEAVLAPTGRTLWVDREADLDAVTAVSGSGPAYVFYLLEALIDSAQQMGLSAEQGRQLALATMAGATALAAGSDQPPATLRQQVTSKGGTTFAALEVLEAAGVKASFVEALEAARHRASQLGDEFGA